MNIKIKFLERMFTMAGIKRTKSYFTLSRLKNWIKRKAEIIRTYKKEKLFLCDCCGKKKQFVDAYKCRSLWHKTVFGNWNKHDLYICDSCLNWLNHISFVVQSTGSFEEFEKFIKEMHKKNGAVPYSEYFKEDKNG